MRACIFESSMSILVNGSPTEDFKVGRGLRQGDPLSPFLFLIVAEGLAGLVRRATEIGRFKGYQVNSSLQFQILQFADDTILMGEGIWSNLWSIKVILRSFELVSGMRINFVKSKLYGINVDTNFLEAGSSFLNCRADILPLKFLGSPSIYPSVSLTILFRLSINNLLILFSKSFNCVFVFLSYVSAFPSSFSTLAFTSN
jgi:hypothetical protein